ncbi:hypothetical protein Pan44_13700 [Caulifigura coniformis]|uniref:3-keto-alpha-glucoside-1,2-lyase/3-keto-2-hydroxy-glucal hydratase domain-containing protein n=1 Tax=Caulifigura coniformis TaxID=2527983 RepID=A0A517SB42_9PLAN|nr:DUF1080 domain-containing protein [Caulifigura coniformis]QDT53353.1 hypothetical protein Pan44_13700 [Caulifigura coniformis]
MIRSLAFLVLSAASATAFAQESKSLFDGKTLDGWKGDPAVWSVKDGALTATTSEGQLKYNTFLVWQGGDVKDFELTAKYKMVGGNSGIQYRSKLVDPEKFIVAGYQADIDSKPRYTGINYSEKTGRNILAERGQKVTIGADGKKEVESIGDAAELQKKIKMEDWNDYRIVARGNRLQHFINGDLMSEVIDNETDKAANSGVLALQAHTGPPMTVQFKDITIKELK